MEFASLSVPGRPGAVSDARHFMADLCRDWGLNAVCDTATLLVSETVTNSIVHGRSDVELTVQYDTPTLRVGIADHDRTMPERRETMTQQEGGRGLWLVEALADEWGVEPAPDGKRVWFLLDSGQKT